MAHAFSKVVLTAVMALLPVSMPAQGTYTPGQTFSAGGSATPTPAPYGSYTVPQIYRAPTQQPTQQRQPVQQQPVRQAVATPMYNLQRTATPRPESRSEERERTTEKESSAERESAQSSNKAADTEKKLTVTRNDESSSKKDSDSEDKKSEETEKTQKPEAKTDTESEAKATAEADDKPVVAESTDKLTFFSRKTGKKWVALTYDDGPNKTLTPELTEYLKANNVPATFFVLGEMVKANPEMVTKLAEDGFELANHTYSHPDLRKKSPEQVRSELQETHDLIKEASGIDVKLMRPPFGAHNSKVDAVCEDMGYKIILWDVDTEDWRKRSTDSIINTIMSKTGDGSIILMHDRTHAGRKTVLEATKAVVPRLRAKGYTFVTAGQLVGAETEAPKATTIAQDSTAQAAGAITPQVSSSPTTAPVKMAPPFAQPAPATPATATPAASILP